MLRKDMRSGRAQAKTPRKRTRRGDVAEPADEVESDRSVRMVLFEAAESAIVGIPCFRNRKLGGYGEYCREKRRMAKMLLSKEYEPHEDSLNR